jgi:hypothetical protein
LVLILNKSENIRKGNVVLFKPDNSTFYTKVPDNTFHDILNTGIVNSNGLFQFLSVAGHWQYQLEYNNGKLKSFGLIKPKNDDASRVNTLVCTDWYLVVDWYDVYGNYAGTTTEFMTESCQDCENSMYQSFCSDGGNSGGNGTEYEYAVTKPAEWVVIEPTSQWWKVKSYEVLNGSRQAGQNTKFTSITHTTSTVFNPFQPGYATWQQLSAVASLQTDYTAKCIISGKVSITGYTDIDVSQQEKSWYAPIEFP